MTRYLFFMALLVSLIFTQASYAREYIFVLSPAQTKTMREAQSQNILRFLSLGTKPGDTAIIIDGKNLVMRGEFEAKDDPKYNNPKIKMRMNPSAIKALVDFAKAPSEDGLQGGIQIPQLYQYLGQNFGPFTDTQLIIMASPLYQDKFNLEWGIFDNMYPGDGHLNTSSDTSQFSVVGRENLLKNVTIHWGHVSDWASSNSYRQKVTRFHYLFAEGYGAVMATFTEDMATHWKRFIENAQAVPHGYKRDDTDKLETIQLIDRPVDETRTSIYERELETASPTLADLRQARDVQIGISWDAKDVDLDLYVQPHASAEVLYFNHRVSDLGYYHKDYQNSPETENGYETVTMNVPLDLEDVLIAVNHYSGRAETISGEIRLAIGEKTYGMPFELKTTRGNKGLGEEKTITTRTPANDHWLVIDPKKIMGL